MSNDPINSIPYYLGTDLKEVSGQFRIICWSDKKQMIYFYLTLTGILAGVLGALLGIGGGIIMLPATHFLLGFNTTEAVGTTLFAIMFTAASGALGHLKKGNVIVKYAALVGGGGLLGVIAGSYIFKDYLSGNIRMLEIMLGLLFLVMALRTGIESYRELRNRGQHNSNLDASGNKTPRGGLVLLGVFTGTLTGVLGLGGGFIMVPAMMWFFGVKTYEAVGTTLLAMFPIAVLGGILKLQQGFVDLSAGLLLGMGTIIGAMLGVYVSRMIKPVMIKVMFAFIFTYLAFNYLFIF
ncbi:MAG: sulfite exporter TauE/SafE family protein [Syntrophomonadaceae bacterium]|nr:sulfite exporter TauE/SafE family protein [Syntrophomonadaceae bacterium]